MNITQTEQLNKKQKLEILGLWNAEYPADLMLLDVAAFEEYLAHLSDRHHLLLTDVSGAVLGWLIDFIRDGERNFAMLLHPSLQGKGFGSRLLDCAKKNNSELNGWVIDTNDLPKQNGTFYKSPIGFYKKNGFAIHPGVKLEKKGINGIKVRWQKNKQ
jgi:GNAT superfamily N-acetyltransferase